MHRLLLILTSCILTATLATAQTHTNTVSTYGEGCGPVASGAVTPNGATNRVTFTIGQAKPSTPVVIMIGVFEGFIPLFDPGCALLIDPIFFTQNHRTDAAGTYSFSKALPATNIGDARIQFAEVDLSGGDIVIRTTNGLLLEMR